MPKPAPATGTTKRATARKKPAARKPRATKIEVKLDDGTKATGTISPAPEKPARKRTAKQQERDTRAESTKASITAANQAAAAADAAATERKLDDPPADVAPDLQQVWRVSRAELSRLALWNEVVRPQLDEYVYAKQDARRARAAAATDPYVEGSTGQMVEHPGFKLAAAADNRAMTLAKELLLTPAARRRAGVKDESPDGADPMGSLLDGGQDGDDETDDE